MLALLTAIISVLEESAIEVLGRLYESLNGKNRRGIDSGESHGDTTSCCGIYRTGMVQVTLAIPMRLTV